MITSQNRFDDNYYTSISTVIQQTQLSTISSSSSSSSLNSNSNSPTQLQDINSPPKFATIMNNLLSQQQQLNSNQNDLQIKRDKEAILK